MGYWTAFSRSGDPNGVGRPDWPMAGGGDTQLMLFRNDGPSATPVPDSARLDLIERFRERSHAISKSSQVTVKTHY